MSDLSGKVAVVTGAASGIGLGLATQACREGMNLRYEAAIGRDGMPVKPGAEALLARGPVEVLGERGVEIESL